METEEHRQQEEAARICIGIIMDKYGESEIKEVRHAAIDVCCDISRKFHL